MSKGTIVSVTLRVNLKIGMGEVVEKGKVFTPPFPDFIRKEIKSQSTRNPTLDFVYAAAEEAPVVEKVKEPVVETVKEPVVEEEVKIEEVFRPATKAVRRRR